RLIEIEKTVQQEPDSVRRLAALCVRSHGDAERLFKLLKLSSRDHHRLESISAHASTHRPESPEKADQRFIYLHGAQAFQDSVLLGWAQSDADVGDPSWVARFTLVERWQAPKFPVSGADVLALGIPAGPNVGKILAEVERWWMAEDFPNDTGRIHARLGEIAKVTKS
nr:CCA tRNA nucleotidyltransferase [Alphaproteobacteria bacterium]